MSDHAASTDLAQPGLPALGDAIDFLRLIWAADHALQRRSKAMMASLGISGPQRLVIRIVGRFPGMHARQLAEILHVHPSALTAILKRLERRGLVHRRPDERDRRRMLLGLTRQGQTINRAAAETIEAGVRTMLDTVAKRDLDGARVVLTTLTRILNAARS